MQSIFRLPDNLMEHLPGPDEDIKVWVVGGALRDHLLGRSYEDLDFAVKGDAIELARQLANVFSWDFFVLDDERCSARILPKERHSPIRRLDFVQLRGSDIDVDLNHRDFTINAMGLNVHELSQLIDPTDGINDLRLKQLRTCAPDSLRKDPVRAIRAVRFATELDFTMHSDTVAQLKRAGEGFQDVSIERIRDELFRILNGEHVRAAVSILDHTGILEAIFPDLIQYKIPSNGGTGNLNAWQLRVIQMRRLSELVHILAAEHDAEAAADAIWGSVALQLGRFRTHLSSHLQEYQSDDRSIKSLIYFAIIRLQRDRTGGFEFDAGDPTADDLKQDRAEVISIQERASAFRLSRLEGEFLSDLGAAYRELETLKDTRLEDLDIHRYFQGFGRAGVSAPLLYLSHAAAKTAGPPDVEDWARRLNVTRALWEAYFERYREVIAPQPLVDGSELMRDLGINSGPQIGALLRAIREAQVTQQVKTHAEAMAFAKRLHTSGLTRQSD